jgi:hypothetical protein
MVNKSIKVQLPNSLCYAKTCYRRFPLTPNTEAADLEILVDDIRWPIAAEWVFRFSSFSELSLAYAGAALSILVDCNHQFSC